MTDAPPPPSEARPPEMALLEAALSPAADALFWRPTRRNVDSAWYGHIPFAHWIVAAARPRSLVELGSHAGVSYSAFCEAVLQAGLDTRCSAVDTWQGDEHAGFYGEDVYQDLANFHDARYGAFSQLLRCRFDEALAYVPDASVDLLHIDGRHGYDDVSHDFATWRPKLSPRAVVLFHDTNVRERGFGVWRLWAELTATLPHFEFLHEHGLGVLAFGTDVPAAVAGLCRLQEPGAVGRVRERFAQLGERWMLDRTQHRLHREAEALRGQNAALEQQFRTLEAYAKQLSGVNLPAATATARVGDARLATARAVSLEAELRLAHRRAGALEEAARAAEAALQAARAAHAEEAAGLRQDVERLRQLADGRLHERDALLASTSWRLTRPVRAVARRLAARRPPPPAEAAPPVPVGIEEHVPAPAPPAPAEPAAPLAPPPSVWLPPRVSPSGRVPRVLFAAGEPGTPGEQYRCIRPAASACAVGWAALVKPVDQVNALDLVGLDLLVLWRAQDSPHVEGLIEHTHRAGGRVALDLDDLMCRPELARIHIIDGIRTIHATEGGTRGVFQSVQRLLHRVDFAIATTAELADAMRTWQRPAYVLPNGFDDATERRARRAVRARLLAPAEPTPVVRLGYASGSRTHQKDFAVIVEALADVLRARPQARLVLFRSQGPDGLALVMPEEFPALDDVAGQIEWRELVPLAELPDELARFDINLAPLEVGNPFVEAKSELKFFEAALAGACTVASPTGPYRRAIRDGVTGTLADSPEAWRERLLALIDDPALRARLARDAYHDVLWRFGPQRRRELLRGFLARQRREALGEGAAAAARAFVFDTVRPPAVSALPVVGDTETLFRHDALGEAAVTVTIASYNYADTILEALESVRIQTLAPLDLVIVDDRSPDKATLELILDWAGTHFGRFNRLLVLRHLANGGLGATRNTAFAAAETPYLLPLDADNRLLPDCAERLLAAAEASGAAYAYPYIRMFGGSEAILSEGRYDPQRLVGGNYIDAMALIAKWAWAAAGGYYVRRDAMGWEDFSLWCRLAELGLWGTAVPEILAEYHVHQSSMVNAITEQSANKRAMVEFVEQRHPWLTIIAREAAMRG